MSETQRPPGEHESELPSERDAAGAPGVTEASREENAETSLDEPSDDAGGE